MIGRLLVSLLVLMLLAGCASSSGERLDADRKLPPRAPNAYHIAREDPADMLFDESGVRMHEYPWGIEYNPVSVTHYAIASYAHEDYESFWRQMDWLMENAVDRGGFMVWEYGFDYEPYNAKSPWISGMAQGEALIVLIQAYSLTGDGEYLKVAKAALRSFLVPVEMGGVLRPGFWYELYAGRGSDFTKVLNGHMFAVEGLEYYHKYTGDPLADLMFRIGLETVRRELPNFDLGGWSAYDGSGRPASPTYHGVVVRQLWHFWETSGDPLFFDYAAKFQEGDPPRP